MRVSCLVQWAVATSSLWTWGPFAPLDFLLLSVLLDAPPVSPVLSALHQEVRCVPPVLLEATAAPANQRALPALLAHSTHPKLPPSARLARLVNIALTSV